MPKQPRKLLDYWHPNYNRFDDEIYPHIGFKGYGPVLPLECFKEFFKAIGKSNLGDKALVVGGFSLEMARRKYNPRLPVKKSKDLDYKEDYPSGVLNFIEKYYNCNARPAAFIEGCVITNIPIPYDDTVPGLKWPFYVETDENGKKQKLLGIDILDRQSFIDDEPNGVLQGLKISGYPFGKLGPKTWFTDPASTAIIRARIMSQERHPRKSLPQVELAMNLIPDMLEDQTAAYEAGTQPRDPSVVANRLLGEIKNPKLNKYYQSACGNNPNLYQKVLRACTYFAKDQKDIFYH